MNGLGPCLTASGREVGLRELKMSLTWRGLLAGTREKSTAHRRKSNYKSFIEEMQEEFGVEKAALVLDDLSPEFPQYRWVALFEGEPIKSKEILWQSHLGVCWFTEVIPANLDEMIAGVISPLVWEEVAEDFDDSW
jgi:hypothetical protein